MRNIIPIILFFTFSSLFTHADDLNAQSREKVQILSDIFRNNVFIERLPINSSLNDFGPCIIGQKLYFSSFNRSSKRKSGNYDIYQVNINSEGDIISGKSLMPGIVSKFNEGPLAFCKKTGEIYMTSNDVENPIISSFNLTDTKVYRLEIVILRRLEGKWVVTEEFPFNNNRYSTGHAAFSPSGDTLIFVSNKPGGLGQTDLYMSTRKGKEWTEPLSLGSKINTSGKELYPFMTSGKILIFASNGIDQGEGLNLYYTVLNGENKDYEVIKFPEPINSPKDDFGMVLSPTQLFAYFTSNRSGNTSDDIYKIGFKSRIDEMLVPEIAEPKVAIQDKEVSAPDGKKESNPVVNEKVVAELPMVMVQPVPDQIKDIGVPVPDPVLVVRKETELQMVQPVVPVKKEVPVPAPVVAAGNEPQAPVVQHMPVVAGKPEIPETFILRLVLVDAETKAPLPESKVFFNTDEAVFSDRAGMVTKKLDPGKDYDIRAGRSGYLNNSIMISADCQGGTIRLNLNMYRGQVNREYVLENIYFDFDKWEILPSSAFELDKLVRIMKENLNLCVEIESHADSRGEDGYNRNLSLKRAESVVNYVINRGVSGSRIKTSAMGESNPYVVSPANEADYRLNRRTTFTITKLGSPGTEINSGSKSTVSSDITPPAPVQSESIMKIDPSGIKGLNYRVQIVAARSRFDPETKIKNLAQMVQNAGIIITLENGLYKYQIGTFDSRSGAQSLSRKIKSMGQDAVIVEYQDNQRIK